MPNPSVVIEFGYARGILTDRRILLLTNTAFGPAQEFLSTWPICAIRRSIRFKRM